MFAVAVGPSNTGSPLSNLFFAIQPEPDLEFTEEELEQTTETRSSSSPAKPPKKSGGRPLLWLMLLVLVGGGAYVAMEPEMVLDWVNQLTGESSAPEPPPMRAATPAAPAPAPGAPEGQPAAPATGSTPPAPGLTPPQAAAPTATAPSAVPAMPAPAPAPNAAVPPVPAMPPAPSTAPKGPVAAAPPSAIPAPMFGEGQRVTVVLDPAAAGDTVMLSQDASGLRPGLTVRPGTPLTILDGDFQPTGWVYSVRTDDGAKGWVAEKRLRLKP